MPEEATSISVRVRITGRVQGVWFRAWTAERAESLGIDGWVRNRGDGAVEAMFAGPKSAVEQIIAACHDGPRAARVDVVSVVDALEPDCVEAGSGFHTLPTE